MSVTAIPAGYRGPHILADYIATRRCKTCGECTEKFFAGRVMRAERIAAWGPESLRRMARELDIPKSTLSEMERGKLDFTEDQARAYLVALGIL